MQQSYKETPKNQRIYNDNIYINSVIEIKQDDICDYDDRKL